MHKYSIWREYINFDSLAVKITQEKYVCYFRSKGKASAEHGSNSKREFVWIYYHSIIKFEA